MERMLKVWSLRFGLMINKSFLSLSLSFCLSVYIKTYGCQMNVNDTEIASTILTESGYQMINSNKQVYLFFK